jgi:hypothetical protein
MRAAPGRANLAPGFVAHAKFGANMPKTLENQTLQ